MVSCHDALSLSYPSPLLSIAVYKIPIVLPPNSHCIHHMPEIDRGHFCVPFLLGLSAHLATNYGFDFLYLAGSGTSVSRYDCSAPQTMKHSHLYTSTTR